MRLKFKISPLKRLILQRIITTRQGWYGKKLKLAAPLSSLTLNSQNGFQKKLVSISKVLHYSINSTFGKKMKVNVKILRGAECTLDVQPDLHVLEFKKMVESNLKVPVNEQKLLLKGKLLLDWKKLNDYDIKEDSKLNLVVLGNKDSAPNTSKSPRKDILEIEMTKFLRRYFSDSDAKKIAEEYMKEFYRKTSACNLEDWERIATGYLNEERTKQKPS